MSFEALLEKKRKSIIKKWFDVAINTYPLDTSRFLNTKKDNFANPVGSTLSHGMEVLFDELVKGPDREKVMSVLDPIVRIRAIQDFSPSKALAFLLSLKKIVREILQKEIKSSKGKFDKDLIAFDQKVDELLLFAFDIFMACREKIFDLKANEEKSKVYKAFKRAGLIQEVLDDDQDLMESKV